MANAYMYQFRFSPVPAVSELFAKITIGATGAPTLSAANSKGIASITRNAAGKYTIVLNDSWNKFLNLKACFLSSSGAAAPDVCVFSEAVSASKSLIILCQAGGVNTDPANGEVMYLQIVLKNTSAN